MRCDKKNMLLYAVTDRAFLNGQSLYEQISAALCGGATCVQLREKALSDEAFLAEARLIGSLCKSRGVPFIINDNIDVAQKCGADGIHIGQEDMPLIKARRKCGSDMIIGVSVHSVEEAIRAEADGADYLGIGAVFPTSTKDDAQLLELDTLRAICAAIDIPTVAIGGICRSNIAKLAGTGVDGIALVSAIFSADDIEAECRLLRRLSEEAVGIK